MLNVTGNRKKIKCKSLNMIILQKDQTRYTLGKKEQIDKGCQYQISLISIPAYNNNNTVVVTQSTQLPICDQSIAPNYQISLIQQYNYNGKSNYSLHLLLESDPAALQALAVFTISISNHERFDQSADKFPSYLFPTDHNSSMTSFGSECFSDKVHKEYLCSDNCDSLQYKDTDREKCIRECEDASEYRISLRKFFPSSETLTIWFTFFYKKEYKYRCGYNPIQITSLNARCYPSTPPRNLSLLSSNSTEEGTLTINLTWIPPEYSHGNIEYYSVEFYYNDTDMPVKVEKRTENNETVLKDMHIDQIVVIRVRADNGCKHYSWSSTLTIDPADFFPSQQPSSDDTPYHRYYIASGVIVGCMVFAVVVLTVIIFFCCYMYQANEDHIKIDESIIDPGTPIKIHNPTSDIIESIELPIDHWEISPDNVIMDQSTFLACGNFGEVYKGKLKTATKSYNKSYLAGKLVAVKILKEDAGGDLKQEFLQEIKLMKKVAEGSNPYVVNMIGCCTIEEPLALIMEFVSGGNLLGFLKARRRKPSQELDKIAAPHLKPQDEYSEISDLQSQQTERKPLNVAELLTFAYQIACGMEYLGEKGIIHRDLACRNVLVGDNNAMKIADFGLSKHLYDDPVYVKSEDGQLPIRWMAIEAILERKYSVQSDVWSFGIVIWEMFTFGGYPYPSLTNIEVVDAILKGYRMECPNSYLLCPLELYALVERCWHADPEHRPSFDMLTSEISNMIPDHDPTHYVEITRYDPYCEMQSAKEEKRFFSSDNVHVDEEEEEDKL
ncbi:fibroblast growth factor receptor 2-like [Dysidea avara]|uniref:fibroblast growth factor receptor 2-like n=1 Tax=Dysidea avara TaxID=196820 RepID=UPI003323981C